MSVTVFIPRDTTALALGAQQIAVRIEELTQDHGDPIKIVRNGSRGLFWLEPLIEIETDQGRVAYGPVSIDDLPGLLDAGMLNGSQQHPLCQGLTEAIPYLKNQQRLTFARAGITDPLSIDDYLAHAGFKGLNKALQSSPQAIVDAVKTSGLRGRGGAAFPTGIKWQTVLDAQAKGGDLTLINI